MSGVPLRGKRGPSLLCTWLAVAAAAASGLLVARAQGVPPPPTLHPLSPREAREELAQFHQRFDREYVPVIPRARVRLDSGIVITVRTAQMRHGDLHVTGTVTNTAPAAAPRGEYGFMLNQSYQQQVAHYQRVPVGLGVCAGPCMTSHDEENVEAERSPPGRTAPYSLVFKQFSRRHPHLRPADMIFWINFLPR